MFVVKGGYNFNSFSVKIKIFAKLNDQGKINKLEMTAL